MKKGLAILLAVLMMFGVASAEVAEPDLTFECIGEAYHLIGNTGYCNWGDEKVVVLLDINGCYFRVVATVDEVTIQKREAMLNAEEGVDLFDDYQQSLESLPVDYVEEITAKPIPQAELDKLANRTLAELEANGYSVMALTWTGGETIIITVANGFFAYDCPLNASIEEYEKLDAEGKFSELTIKSAQFVGLSNNGLNLGYHADGSYEVAEDAGDDYNALMQFIFDTVEDAMAEGITDPAVVISELTELMPAYAADFQELVPLFFDVE